MGTNSQYYSAASPAVTAMSEFRARTLKGRRKEKRHTRKEDIKIKASYPYSCCLVNFSFSFNTYCIFGVLGGGVTKESSYGV